MKIKGVTKVDPAAVARCRGARRHGRGDARGGVQALKVTSDTSGAAAASFDSVKAKADYAAKGERPEGRNARAEYKVSDAAAAIEQRPRGPSRRLTRRNHNCRAQMEPMNAVARGRGGRQVSPSVETARKRRARGVHDLRHSRFHARTRSASTSSSSATARPAGLAGCTIRRPLLSNITKKPVKLILTREEDIGRRASAADDVSHGSRPGSMRHGNLVGWHHRLVSENVDAVAAPPRFKATSGRGTSARAATGRRSMRSPNVFAIVAGGARHARARLARHRFRLRRVRSLPKASSTKSRPRPAEDAGSRSSFTLTKDLRARYQPYSRSVERCPSWGSRRTDPTRRGHHILGLPRQPVEAGVAEISVE